MLDPTRHPAVLDNIFESTRDIYRNRSVHAYSTGAFALATRAPAVLDLVARGAGLESFAQAVDHARAGDVHGDALAWIRELGRVSYQAVEGDHAQVSVAFFSETLRRSASFGFREIDLQAYVEGLLLSQGPDAAESVLSRETKLSPLDRACMAIDILRAREGAPSENWLSALNSGLFEASGVSPVALGEDEGPVFDRLRGTTSRRVQDGPLVTVIMTTFQRRTEIDVAVRSILAQTWTNLELLIVDDASGSDFTPTFEALEAMDPRVSVIRMEQNRGAYVARNEALRHAQGEYVTFQDDDDWSHPERLERQVAPLIDDPDTALTLSVCVRATEDLSFRYRAAKAFRRNASSLMFRRADLDRVGRYDTVRKAADSEFIERLLVLTGGRQHVVDSVLSVVRLSTASLSRADFGVGWHHPARDEYRESYQGYHRQLLYGRTQPLDGSAHRWFPAPRRFLGAEAAAELPSRFDVVVASDWRYVDADAGVAWQIVQTAIQRGEQVGIVHLADFRNPGKGLLSLASQIRDELVLGRVDRIFSEDAVAIETLVIDDAARLELVVDDRWACSVAELGLVAMDLPIETDETSTWSVQDVEAAAQRMFEPESTRWFAASAEVGSGLAGRESIVATVDLRPLAAIPDESASTRTVGIAAHPRLGRRVSASSAGLGRYSHVYPTGDSCDVRMLAIAADRSRGTAEWPTRWLVYRPSDLTFTDYLRQLDFYVLYGDDVGTVDSVLAAVRAAAAGVVVVADPLLESHLGPAAVYRAPVDVQPTITSLHADPVAYAAQAQRAHQWCSELRASRDAAGVPGL